MKAGILRILAGAKCHFLGTLYSVVHTSNLLKEININKYYMSYTYNLPILFAVDFLQY
jgi:hypothetical protein